MMATKQIFDDVPAWPDKSGPAPAGHNNPPIEEQVAAEFRERLLSERPDFLTRLDQIVDASARVFVTDDETLGRAGDMMKLIRAAAKHVEVTHVEVKAPYLAGGRAADGEKNILVGQLEVARKTVEKEANAFVAKREAKQRAERDRIAAEERRLAAEAAAAERKCVEAEQAARAAMAAATSQAERDEAASKAAEARREAEDAVAAAALAPSVAKAAEPVRSDAGATVSTTTVWECEVDDYAKALRHVRSDPKVKEVIDAAIKRLVRAGQRELTGVTIRSTQKAVAR